MFIDAKNKTKQKNRHYPVDFGVKKKKRLVLLLPGLWNGIWWGLRCEHFILEEAGQGVMLKAWRASQCQSLTPSCWDEMRWVAVLCHFINTYAIRSPKKMVVCVKKVSSNFVNDKIVIVILIGLWLSQAGSTDTISWMIKCIYFSTCTHSY